MSDRRYRHPQVNLRLPEDLKDKISKLADSNKRSANAEMVAAIEYWVDLSLKNRIDGHLAFSEEQREILSEELSKVADKFAESMRPYLEAALDKKRKEIENDNKSST